MLSVDELQEFAKRHDLGMRVRYGVTSARGGQPPAASATIWFKREQPDAWRELMTSLTQIPVTIYGTRQVTGSGSTDNRLYPAYAALLKEVNSAREAIGLERVWS